jgi:hypothetical protein
MNNTARVYSEFKEALRQVNPRMSAEEASQRAVYLAEAGKVDILGFVETMQARAELDRLAKARADASGRNFGLCFGEVLVENPALYRQASEDLPPEVFAADEPAHLENSAGLKLQKLADKRREEKPALTKEQAYIEVLEANHDLYAQSMSEI